MKTTIGIFETPSCETWERVWSIVNELNSLSQVQGQGPRKYLIHQELV